MALTLNLNKIIIYCFLAFILSFFALLYFYIDLYKDYNIERKESDTRLRIIEELSININRERELLLKREKQLKEQHANTTVLQRQLRQLKQERVEVREVLDTVVPYDALRGLRSAGGGS